MKRHELLYPILGPSFPHSQFEKDNLVPKVSFLPGNEVVKEEDHHD